MYRIIAWELQKVPQSQYLPVYRGRSRVGWLPVLHSVLPSLMIRASERYSWNIRCSMSNPLPWRLQSRGYDLYSAQFLQLAAFQVSSFWWRIHKDYSPVR